MPIYEYVCTECEQNHEALRKLSDAPLIDCPACGKPSLQKKISAAGFRLSGSGWYETDFKSSKQKNLAESASKPKESKEISASSGNSAKKDAPAKPAKKDAAA